MNIPFNKPVQLEGHVEVLRESFATGHLSGIGPFTKKSEFLLQKTYDKPVRLVSSATHALEAMALLANIKPGDEVIVPSFTFVSTANAFALRGARIRFADNDEYGNILLSEIERLRTNKTRAVVVVDYAGASTDLDKVGELCEGHSIFFFEDAAQAIGGTYKGRPLGSTSTLACLSFHETKNITSGEGGALIIGDETFLDRAEVMREKGTDRQRFFKGFVDKYTWVDIGSSYVLSDLNAAYLYPQIERLEEINNRRRQLCGRYEAELGSVFAKIDARVLGTPTHNTPNAHMFAVVFGNGAKRDKFIAHMKANGVMCPFHYVALHTSPMGLSFYQGGRPDALPGCEKLSAGLVRLPLYYNMTDDEQAYVIEKAKQWLISA